MCVAGGNRAGTAERVEARVREGCSRPLLGRLREGAWPTLRIFGRCPAYSFFLLPPPRSARRCAMGSENLSDPEKDSAGRWTAARLTSSVRTRDAIGQGADGCAL